MLAKFALAVFMMEDLDDTDINFVSPPDELIVDDILHQMGFFLLAKAESRIAKADILHVVFRRIIQIAASAHIIALGFAEKVARSQIPKKLSAQGKADQRLHEDVFPIDTRTTRRLSPRAS